LNTLEGNRALNLRNQVSRPALGSVIRDFLPVNAK